MRLTAGLVFVSVQPKAYQNSKNIAFFLNEVYGKNQNQPFRFQVCIPIDFDFVMHDLREQPRLFFPPLLSGTSSQLRAELSGVALLALFSLVALALLQQPLG